jgi:hypothetical protein
MAIEAPSAAEIFPHVRIVMGMVIGLGVTRLLSGVARIVQHPRRTPVYAVHLGWTLSVLLMLVHFWWWEFGLYHVGEWTFGIYFFLISYSIALFLLCAFLFPESMADYSGYEDYFLSKRIWFFGILASTYLFDYADTLIKGRQHLESSAPNISSACRYSSRCALPPWPHGTGLSMPCSSSARSSTRYPSSCDSSIRRAEPVRSPRLLKVEGLPATGHAAATSSEDRHEHRPSRRRAPLQPALLRGAGGSGRRLPLDGKAQHARGGGQPFLARRR